MESHKIYFIRSRIWVCTDEGTYLGEGRIELLKKIEEYCSISKASRAMKMSYKKAWELVNSMNQQSSEPLVVGTIGGPGGGGSILSKAGKDAIAFFNTIKAENELFLQQCLKNKDQ